MSLIQIAEYASKEDKLEQILEYLEELKTAFSEVVQEYEDDGAEEEIVDLLTGALDAVEDAHDVILDVVEEAEDL